MRAGPNIRFSRLAAPLLALALAATASGCGSEPPAGRAPDYRRALAGAPPPLASLHRQANRLLDGGPAAYERRIASLRGYPVVVNVWASWCGPCRYEFPFLQRLSARFGRRIAFLGVNSQDFDDAASTFLRDHPVPYPSYRDPDRKIFNQLGGIGLPVTAFYDRRGELVMLNQKPYTEQEQLAAEIRRYALGGGGGA